MGDFDVALFVTRALHDRCERAFDDGWKARDVAAAFVEGAFARSDAHSVTVELAADPVEAPTEVIHGRFDAPVPASRTDDDAAPVGSETGGATAAPDDASDGTWPTLRRWWDAWMNERDRPAEAAFGKDCNLLLTAAPGGGLGGPRETCAGGSFTVAEAYDEYRPWGAEPAFNKVDTLLEELGHTLVHGMEDRDYGDGVVAHDSGTLYEHDGTYAITPIGISGNTRYNNCSERVDKDRWNGDAWEARYSECTERYFTER